MKRACMLLVLALLLLTVATGCQDESKPAFTRLRVTPECGVVPMDVEGYAVLSGGNETGDPLGGNNSLEIKWDFGDGGTGNTTIAYHRYYTEGEHTVTVTGRDPDGNVTTAQIQVTALSDSLIMLAGSDFPDGNVTTADTVRFQMIEVTSCDVDFPEVQGDSVKLEFKWEMGDADATEYNVVAPEFQFLAAGPYEVNVSVFYPAWAVVRQQTLNFNVTDP
jgi:hypothetical protein